MSNTITRVRKLVETAKQNREELFASLAIFIGLPIVGFIYFDYRAAFTIFVIAIGTVSLIAMRKK